MTEGDFLRLADVLPDALLLVATDGTVLAANRGIGAELGRAPGEVVGRSLAELAAEPPEAVADYLRLCARSRQRVPGALTLTGVPCRCEGALVQPGENGAPAQVLLRVAPRDRAVKTFLELNQRIEQLNREIARRTQAEQSLAETNRRLQQRSREIEQFVYIVSHDLKSPLVTIMGFSGMLRESVAQGDAASATDAAARIERAGRRMNLLIDDLLEFSRIGRIRNDPEEIDVTALVRELAESLADRLESAGATVEVADALPHLMADRARVSQVFDNLLTNAIKHGCRPPQAKIEVGAVSKPDEVRYFVRDNGPGIPPEYHQKIFGLFQRLGSASDGTGIGLALVEKVMQFYGGRAWVESAPGQGATFWLAWPRQYLAAR